jgi:hypothetical protein
MTPVEAMADMVGEDVFSRLEWTRLTPVQREAVFAVFRQGLNAGASSGAIAAIEDVLGEGRIVLCDDGTLWETDVDTDAELVEEWGEGALVAIHRGRLYRLFDGDSVDVEPLRL